MVCDFDDVLINQFVNTQHYNTFYNTTLSDIQRKRFNIFAQRCCNIVGIQLENESMFVNKVARLLMMKHYFMLE
jgi:hypothetical protein